MAKGLETLQCCPGAQLLFPPCLPDLPGDELVSESTAQKAQNSLFEAFECGLCFASYIVSLLGRRGTT